MVIASFFFYQVLPVSQLHHDVIAIHGVRYLYLISRKSFEKTKVESRKVKSMKKVESRKFKSMFELKTNTTQFRVSYD